MEKSSASSGEKQPQYATDEGRFAGASPLTRLGRMVGGGIFGGLPVTHQAGSDARV